MFRIHKTRTQTDVYRSIFTHHSLRACNQFTSTEWKKTEPESFIHTHLHKSSVYLHGSKVITTITVTWKSSHLKTIMHRHMQQWTNHHGCVQYVCVYVCVSECRCACVCGDSLSCTLTATASAGAVSMHSLYHVGRQQGWACVCVCVCVCVISAA